MKRQQDGELKTLRRLARLIFPAHLPGGFIIPEAEKSRVAEKAGRGPFREADLSDELGRDPLNITGRRGPLRKRSSLSM
jgi:hypothetical protein